MKKHILLSLLAIALVTQFIQPVRSVKASDPANDMLVMTNAPEHIKAMVVSACFDCHSDHPAYPAWAYITPINFVIQGHINEGREKLNFSRWNEPSSRAEAYESAEEMNEGKMPPPDYANMQGMHSLRKISVLNSQSGSRPQCPPNMKVAAKMDPKV